MNCRTFTKNTNWGCGNSIHKINIHITNEINQRIFPKNGSFELDEFLKYKLHGYNANSPEIVFNFFSTPLSVTNGQKFRVWYGEDLITKTEQDNGGKKSCVDVYGVY